jgi:hypothetical protein
VTARAPREITPPSVTAGGVRAPARGGRLTRALLRCGLAAGPVFAATTAVEGALRPDYRALRHPVSSLALGTRGWVQVANFTVSGMLCAAFAAGLRRAATPADPPAGPLLFGAAAGGLLLCGLFPADPVNGYPPGTPLTPDPVTPAGLAHLVASSAIMVGVPATTALYARSALRAADRRWAGLSAAVGALAAGSFAAACAGFAQVPRLPRVAGGFQRLAMLGGFGWLQALAVRSLRRLPR